MALRLSEGQGGTMQVKRMELSHHPHSHYTRMAMIARSNAGDTDMATLTLTFLPTWTASCSLMVFPLR